MPGWQVTAKTIYCEAVEDEVTVLVYQNGSTRCTGYKKYTEPNDVTRQVLKAKTKHLKRSLKCEGEQCPRVTQYKEQILAEEKQ
jgi:TATA-box binding protein (TBP) (component of TFIID and TFIIIB)